MLSPEDVPIPTELQVRPGFKRWLSEWRQATQSQPSSPERIRQPRIPRPSEAGSSTHDPEDAWLAPPTSHAYRRGSGPEATRLISSAQSYKESASQYRFNISNRPSTAITGGSSFSTPSVTFGHTTYAQQKNFHRNQTKVPEKTITFTVSIFEDNGSQRIEVSVHRPSYRTVTCRLILSVSQLQDCLYTQRHNERAIMKDICSELLSEATQKLESAHHETMLVPLSVYVP